MAICTTRNLILIIIACLVVSVPLGLFVCVAGDENDGRGGGILQGIHEPHKSVEICNTQITTMSDYNREIYKHSEHVGHGGSAEEDLAHVCPEDSPCMVMALEDRLGLEAIRALHRQLDDDANGNVDLSESVEFLKEELQYEDGYEKRQKAFHRNDDVHISVRELWEAWIKSEVHNWTVEQASEWLAAAVELPQYIPNFIQNKVDGSTLPRLATNNMQFLSNTIGIKDPIHKQKIALKAMDVVLFGPPKELRHRFKDVILVSLLVGALGGCWYAYRQNKFSQQHLQRMVKDMESLQKAECTLQDLQKELERAREEQAYVVTEKLNLEKKLQERGPDSPELIQTSSEQEMSRLRGEIDILRNELQRAEVELEDKCWVAPPALQHWLQLTHELEMKSYQKKKNAAEKQLQQARDACEKLRKKRSSLVGAFVSTHGKSIDDVDKSIVEARTSLNEVTQDLQERVHRWKQVELLCGFNVINNPGLLYLETLLHGSSGRSSVLRGGGLTSTLSGSQDIIDDDTTSLYSPSAAGNVTRYSDHVHHVPMRRSSTLQSRESGTSLESFGNTGSGFYSSGALHLEEEHTKHGFTKASAHDTSVSLRSHGASSNYHGHTTLDMLMESLERRPPRCVSSHEITSEYKGDHRRTSSLSNIKDQSVEWLVGDGEKDKDSLNEEDGEDKDSGTSSAQTDNMSIASTSQFDGGITFTARDSSLPEEPATNSTLADHTSSDAVSKRSTMVKSLSHDTYTTPEKPVLFHKMSLSESSLHENIKKRLKKHSVPSPPLKEEGSDSSLNSSTPDIMGKKKKRLLIFPSFSKKSKNKKSS